MNCLKPEDFKEHCPRVDCSDRCDSVPFVKTTIPAALGDDSADSPYAPENGAYKNALVEYEANGALYIYSSDGIFTKLGYNTQGGGDVTKNYVDDAIADALTESKGYTDNSISTSTTNMTTYVDNADAGTLQSAKNYADSKDAQVLQDAKDYTDAHSGQGGVSQQYVDDQDAATLQSAQDYTDGEISDLSDTLSGAIDDAIDDLAEVARTGDYMDLVGTPDIPVITLTTVDPGEGGALAENHFIGVYS